jgi:hypothetical protein
MNKLFQCPFLCSTVLNMLFQNNVLARLNLLEIAIVVEPKFPFVLECATTKLYLVPYYYSIMFLYLFKEVK